MARRVTEVKEDTKDCWDFLALKEIKVIIIVCNLRLYIFLNLRLNIFLNNATI